MFGPYTYIIWLVCFIALPLVALIVWRGQIIWQKRRALAWILVGSLVGGWAWDALAVRVGVWYYDPNHLVGWWWAGLPLEEWLWIAGITLMFGSVTILLADHIVIDPVHGREET